MSMKPAGNSLEFLFKPRSVAIVGVSRKPDSQGFHYLRQHLEFPFPGAVYPIAPRESEILGVRCCPSLREVDGPVDHVISCIPYDQVLSLIDDCAVKAVRSIHLFTARLAETQLQSRIALEREIVLRARQGGMRLIGPNCLGLYCPKAGLTFRFNLPKESGHVAFLSQSGGYAADIEYQGAGRGLRFSKIISFGNAADLNESDFFEYLIEDEETRIIAMYLEGVKEGRRFIDLLRRCRGRKPVVIFKGGVSGAGSRAAVSHTASLSGGSEVWQAVFRQNGVVSVRSMQEMADALLAFQFLRPASGRRALVIGGGGGASVAAADVCEAEGFEVPPLPSEIRKAISVFAPDAWTMISNPMDSSAMGDLETMTRACDLAVRWKDVDVVVGDSSAAWFLDFPGGSERHGFNVRFFLDAAGRTPKPFVVVLASGDAVEKRRVEAMLEEQKRCSEQGVATFPTMGRAVRALAHFTRYFQRTRERRRRGRPSACLRQP